MVCLFANELEWLESPRYLLKNITLVNYFFMRSTTTSFDNLLNVHNKKPQMYVSMIEPTTGNLVLEHFRTHRDNAMIDSPGQEYVDGLQDISFNSGQVDFLSPHTTPGQVTAVFNENYTTNKTFSEFIASNKIIGSTISAYYGFQGLPVEDYMLVFVGVVTTITSVDSLTWSIRARQKIFSLNTPIFQNMGKGRTFNSLSESYALGITLQESFGTTNFVYLDKGAAVDQPFNVSTCFKIEDELIKYELITSFDIAGILREEFEVITRGYAGTTAVAHDGDIEVTQVFIFECSPIELALYLFETKQGGVAKSSIYDLGPNITPSNDFVFSFNLPEDSIDVSFLEDLSWRNCLDIEGSFDDPIIIDDTISNGLDFIEDNLLKPIAAFMNTRNSVTTPGDSLSIKSKILIQQFDWVDWNEDFANLKVSDIGIGETIDERVSFDIFSRDLVSKNEWNWFLDKSTGQLQNKFIYDNQLVINEHGDVSPILSVNSDSLPDIINTDTTTGSIHFDTLKQLTYRWFKNYDPPIEISVEVLTNKLPLESLDLISYSNDKLPSLSGPSWDNERCAIVRQDFNFSRGRNKLRLITFTQFSKVLNGTLYTINKVPKNLITKKQLTLHPNISAPADFSEDGFYDNVVSAYKGHLFIIYIQITEPSAPADPSIYDTQEISLQVSCIKNDAFQCIDKRRNVKYSVTGNSVRVIKINLWSTSQSVDESTVRIVPDRIKAEWFAASTSDPVNHPDVKLVGVDFIRFSFDY